MNNALHTAYIVMSDNLRALGFKSVMDNNFPVGSEIVSLNDFQKITLSDKNKLDYLFLQSSLFELLSAEQIHKYYDKIILLSDEAERKFKMPTILVNTTVESIIDQMNSMKLFIADNKPDLSSRETDVLALLVHGLMNKEIAAKLNISTHTVISHRKNISIKLGIKSVAGLTLYAVIKGIIQAEEVR